MTKRITNYIIILIAVLGLNSCDIMDSQKLTIFNNTNDTMFCFWNTDNYSFYTGNNPLNGQMIIKGHDTTWQHNWNCLLFPKDSSNFADYNWKHTITASETNKLHIHLYKTKLFYNKSEIIKDPIKRDTVLIYTYDELQKINWKIYLK